MRNYMHQKCSNQESSGGRPPDCLSQVVSCSLGLKDSGFRVKGLGFRV